MPKRSSAVSLARLRDDFLEHQVLAGHSELTTKRYSGYTADFISFAGRRGVAADSDATDLDVDLIRDYQLALAKRRTADDRPITIATRNLYAAALRGMLRHGVSRLGLSVPAPDTVVVGKVGDRTMRRLEVDEFEKLVEAIPKDSPNRLRDRALVEVLFATGCRLSELCSLTRRRVNLKTREVEVLGKGQKARGTYLTERAADHLQRYLDTRRDDSPFLFVSRQRVRQVKDKKTGEVRPVEDIYPLSPRTVQHLVTRLGMRAGLPEGFSPHWFRHGRLTLIARHSGLLAAQELAGHASPQTTRRYTRITSSELKRHFDDADRAERGE